MKMEPAVEAQQAADTAVTESQQITQAQIATLAQVTRYSRTLSAVWSAESVFLKAGLCIEWREVLTDTNLDFCKFHTGSHQTECCLTSAFKVSMAAGHASATGPTVTLVQLPNGQTVQVHGVIQAAQPSVIQSPQVQAVQVKHSWVEVGNNIQDVKFNPWTTLCLFVGFRSPP